MQYTLTCGGAKAVCDTLGGELISYKTADGVERVWCGDAAYWASHAPVLFPVVGSIKEEGISIGGKLYQMAKHGFARKMEFEATEIGETSATFTLKANEATLAQYPAQFALAITHTITETAFTTTYKVTNEGAEEMYFCIGGHSGFSCPINAGESFSDYSLVFDTPVTQTQPLYTDAATMLHSDYRLALDWDGTTLPLKYSDFDNDAYILDGLAARSLSLVHNTTGEGVAYEFHGFEHLGIWTPPGKNAPFLCIEPWHGLPTDVTESGKMEDKPCVTCLAAGESYTAGYTSTIKFAK